ncbi:molybdenum cofactor guanylyltransferase MobA [Paracoccaceae bacterium Fryx2]|nr:molybdenum cofactor guanylyltransferase MobA [Paracoccaceae bacterium Fryx2]
MLIYGVILAGGQGRRMGGADKALLRLAGVPLVQHAADRLAPQVAALAVSANGNPARLGWLGLPVLADAVAQGPLAGVLAALDWAAAAGADAVVSAAVDTPFFPGDLVPRLLLAAESSASGAAHAVCGGRAHPTFALWPVALRDDLRGWLAAGEARLMGFAARHGSAAAPFPPGEPDPFANLNTADDLDRAEALLAARR